jgi:hypothetical protein
VTLRHHIAICFCLILILLLPLFSYSSDTSNKLTTSYSVSAKGFSIGDVTATQRITDDKGGDIVHFETKTYVKASFLWMGYFLDTLESGDLFKGELVRYSRKGRENVDGIDIEGRLENSSFQFNVRENGKMRTVVIPRASYDNSTMECPEARLDFTGKSHITLRILDVEKMAVVNREYHLIQNAVYSVGDKEFPCRIIDFTDQNKAARRWIAQDGRSVILFRQDSKGGKNAYSVKAQSVFKIM